MGEDRAKGGFLKFKFMHSLKSRLILSFLALSIIPLVVVVTLAIYQVHGALREQASNKLIVVRDLKTTQIETYLNEIRQDIKLIAELPYVKTAMQQLEIGARGQGLQQVRSIGYLNRPDLYHLDAYNPYAVYHGKYHAFFSELLKTKEYEDIWLVSADGDIVYTYAKRDDFATNLMAGQYRNSTPARIFKEIRENPKAQVVPMSDYSSFQPAGNVPVTFVGAPIMDEGSLAGVLIYELSMEQINDLMQVYTGFWETGETYLVGEEKLLRTKVRFEKGQDTDTYYHTRVDTQAVQRGLRGESGVDVIENYRDITVLSAYQSVAVDDFKWALLAEVEESEAFAAANRLRNMMIMIILVTTIIVIIIGFKISRSIAGPIVELADTSTSIASGNLGMRAKSGARDEIGHLAEAFNSMTEQLSIVIKSLELEISERRRAEDALQKSESHYRSLFEDSPISLWEEDFSLVKKYLDDMKASGVRDFNAFFQSRPEAVAQCAARVKIRDVNRATLDLLGAESKEELKVSLTNILTKHSEKVFRDWLVVLAKGGVQFQRETSHRAVHGGEKQVVLGLRVVPGYESSQAKILVSLQDISERIKAEDALNRHREHLEDLVEKRTAALNAAKEQAESANMAKSEFLARMSHEIRTPLNAITGLTQVLLKSEMTDDQQDYMGKIQIASKNLMSVINDILDFSKVEAGRMELAHTVFEINKVMEHIADLFSDRASQKKLELIFFTSPEVPAKVSGDPDRLTQVLTNLIGNAIKFTDAGEVLVRVDLEDGADKGESQVIVKFQVTDTGIGVTADALPSLFEPFTQVEGYLTRQHVGTGLGLAISRRLTELMGGRIWVESKPGQGSTFYFTAIFELEEILDRQFIVPENLRHLNVLVVDDSASARQILKDVLESFSFHVTTVNSGEDAIAAISKSAEDHPYQLIVLDWKMPGLDGIETAKHIRGLDLANENSRHAQPISSGPSTQANGTSQVPIIILVSAYGQMLVKDQVNASVVNNMLLKPVKTSLLFNTIMDLFGQTDTVLQIPPQTDGRMEIDRLRGRRVLVVEDNALNRDVAVALLKDKGLSVETVENGHAAVEKVIAAPSGYYDLIFMDIQMPIMDGYDATKKIRQLANRQVNVSHQPQSATRQTAPRIPIIALTAHALTGEKDRCLAADMDDYLAKPINEDKLDRLLLKWISPNFARFPGKKEVDVPVTDDCDSILDVEGALNRLGGRKVVYHNVLKKFGPEFRDAPKEMRRLATLGQYEPVKRTTHSLKGAAATIGAIALSKAAERFEKIIVGQPTNFLQSLEVLEKALANASEAIDRYLVSDSNETKNG